MKGSKLTSQGRYHMDVFSGRFEDIHRTVLQNCNNMQQLTFQYFTQHIQWSKIEKNTTVMSFLIYFQIGVLGTSRGCHFRTLLGLPWDVSLQFVSKWINLIVFGSWWYAESASVREIFKQVLGRSPKMFQIGRTVVFLVFWWIKIKKRDVAIYIYYFYFFFIFYFLFFICLTLAIKI